MNDKLLQADHALTLKSIFNFVAALLGIGSFLGVINLAVGVLSAFWLGVQLYGYLAHELPMKRMRKQILRRDLERGATQPAELHSMGADE